MPQMHIPSEFLFWDKARHHERHKKLFGGYIPYKLPQTKDMHVGKWLSDVNTEFFDEGNRNATVYNDFISTELLPLVQRMLMEVEFLYRFKKVVVRHIWYNHYEAGGHHEPHSHIGFGLAGVYFLQLDEPNTLRFHSPTAAISKLVNDTVSAEFLTEGDIVLFPSHMLHYVQPAQKPRTTISFNLDLQM
jgi:hypothetical protein